MAFRHGHESSAAGRANFSASRQCSFDRRATGSRFRHFRGEENRSVRRCRAEQLNRVIRRHGAGRTIVARRFHQVPRRRPIAVAIEQRADNPAVQHSRKRLIFRRGFPFRHDLIVALRKTANAQTVRIRRPATPARIRGRVAFLQRWLGVFHDYFAPFEDMPGYGRSAGPT